jgi:hypothetical protein
MKHAFMLLLTLFLCLPVRVFVVGGYTHVSGEGEGIIYGIIAISGSTPTIDGSINTTEWNDATELEFNNTQVFVKQDGMNLYVGFNVSDTALYGEGYVLIALDLSNDKNQTLQPDDIAFGITNDGTLLENNVTGGTWNQNNPNLTSTSCWTARFHSLQNIWQAEFNIAYSKIGIVAGIDKTLGVFFAVVGESQYKAYYPPTDEISPESHPSTWIELASVGYSWVPEFPLFLVQLIFMIATLLTVIVYRRRKVRCEAKISGTP